jgi:competence protein ComEC
MPVGISGFFAAQFGIQIGMMVPLSPFYFMRWPVAGAYANLIAIPLVGVVLQLSMLAGLLGIIPGIGIYLALFLSAANWIFSIGFLLIGHYFSRWFIYPFMIRPTVFELGIYFVLCSMFVWWRPLWFRIVRPGWRNASNSRRIVFLALLALICTGVAAKRHGQQQAMRPDGKLAVSILSVGYASGILVDTPDHKAILIDTAIVVTNPTQRVDAERTILPQIYNKQITELEALVVTDPGHEHSDGIYTVFMGIDVNHFYLSAAVAPLLAKEPLASVLEERSPQRLKHRISSSAVEPKILAAGDVIYQSEYEGKPILVEAVGPAAGDDRTPLSVRIQYGDFSMLIPSDLNFEQQKAFLAGTPPEKLKADVVIAPHHGTAGIETITLGLPDDLQQRIADITGAFFKATEADAVLFEFGNPRGVEPFLYKEARKIHGLARRAAEDALPGALVAATDTDGAIHVVSDGVTHHVYTQLSETGSEVDEPTLLETGGW